MSVYSPYTFSYPVDTTADMQDGNNTFAMTTGSHVTASPSSTQAPPGALNTAAVVGIVLSHVVAIAIAYTCGLLTGLIVWRKKNHTPSPSGDLSAPMYEQILLPTQTRISLQENQAYGLFNNK